MIERVERELLIPATCEAVWEAVTGPGWLADEVRLELHPGGEASFRDRRVDKTGWVEEVRAPARLAFWWGVDGQPATRVELTLEPIALDPRIERDGDGTRLRVVECRPLELIDLIGTPLAGGGRPFGPALVAA
ncbi:MAG: SRPBCC family protein [Solirubrobacteraceae bacterium]